MQRLHCCMLARFHSHFSDDIMTLRPAADYALGKLINHHDELYVSVGSILSI
jgi:hypothetical protein